MRLDRLLRLVLALGICPGLVVAQKARTLSPEVIIGGVAVGDAPVAGCPALTDCDVLASCPPAQMDSGGVAFDGRYLWVGHFFGLTIYQIDPATCQVVHSIPAPFPFIGGLAWDGSTLWAVAEQEGAIFRLDPADGSVLRGIPAPAFGQGDPNSAGLAWDGHSLWHTDYRTDLVYELDPQNGDILSSFPAPTPSPSGLGFAGGLLTLSDFECDTLFVLDPADGSVVSRCSTPGPHPWGLAVDSAGDTWLSDEPNRVDTLFLLDTNLPAAECFLVLGSAVGAEAFNAGNHTWTTQLSDVLLSYPVTLDDTPAIPIGRGKLRQLQPFPVGTFAAQVLMWNPEVFPANPEQYSSALEVWLWSDGTATVVNHGTSDGLQIGIETYTDAGTRYLRFPFTIDGF